MHCTISSESHLLLATYPGQALGHTATMPAASCSPSTTSPGGWPRDSSTKIQMDKLFRSFGINWYHQSNEFGSKTLPFQKPFPGVVNMEIILLGSFKSPLHSSLSLSCGEGKSFGFFGKPSRLGRWGQGKLWQPLLFTLQKRWGGKWKHLSLDLNEGDGQLSIS